MPGGTEQTTTNVSPMREQPQVSPAPELKQSIGAAPGGIVARMHEIAGASAAQDPPPQALSRIFRSAEFSQPVNDAQKARALQTLQRSHGNSYVQRMLESGAPTPQTKAIQPKLEVSTPGDSLEREADRMADQVMSMPAPNRQTQANISGGQLNRQIETGTAPHGHSHRVLRASSTAGGAPPVSNEFERNLAAQRGGGHPLPGSTRDFFEPRFGQDLSDVRVHHDADAANAASEINAQAFTQGRDIYFGAGKYQPNSEGGKHLLAHELAHTMQQTDGAGQQRSALGAVQRTGGPVVQRNGAASSSPRSPRNYWLEPDPRSGTVRVSVPTLRVASVKEAATRAELQRLYRRPGLEARGPTDQARLWTALSADVNAALQAQGLSGAGGPYLLKSRSENLAVGSTSVIAERLTRPFWKADGAICLHDIDHIVDLQIAGWPGENWAHNLTNLQLLDEHTNRFRKGDNTSAAGIVGGSIDSAADGALREIPASEFPNGVKPRDRLALLRQYGMVFRAVEGQAISSLHVWERDAIVRGDHLQALKTNRSPVFIYDLNIRQPPPNLAAPTGLLSAHPRNLALDDILGSQNVRLIYRRGGGPPARFRWANQTERPRAGREVQEWTRGFNFTQVNLQWDADSELLGTVSGQLFHNNRYGQEIFRSPITDLAVNSIGRSVQRPPMPAPTGGHEKYAGHIDDSVILGKLHDLAFPGASPLTIQNAGFTPTGLVVQGRIELTIPLLQGNYVDIVFDSDEVRAEKTFTTSALQLPRPFVLRDGSLTLSVGTRTGLRATGRVDFGIERLGQGFLQAAVGTTEGFVLSGGFDFDSATFNPAHLAFRYENGELSGSGEIGIPAGKIRGIRSANLHINYDRGDLTAAGRAEFTIPGITQATLGFSQTQQEGTVITAGVELGSLPGIRSGSISARLAKPAGADAWQLSGQGTAIPNIPGVESSLNVSIDRGIFTAEARASYNRGMLSGTIEAGVTNRPINPEGLPVEGAEPAPSLTPFGRGQLTIRITPWLQGTIGVRILPNGEIEVSGAIGLPSSLPIFSVPPLHKNIFSINIDIPIVGVSVLGHNIGIFATIGGGLDVDAGIGPGELRQLGLTITYNPAHEDQTHVTGRAQLYVPAHAGLRLFVRGGLGVGIPIVDARATITVGGSLGLEGAATADVEVDWLAGRGLIIDASAALYVQPKFKFDVTGEVLVEADLLFKTIELYSKTWQLASFEYGSDLRFGVRFPIHYEEGRDFHVSLSDVEFEVPDIDPMDLLTGLIKRI